MKKENDKLHNDLEARIKAPEDRPSMKYVGTYRDDIGYEPGSVCTRRQYVPLPKDDDDMARNFR